jgi:hypothetical protein
LRAGYFPFGESNQSHCAGHDGFADFVSAKLPSVLAERQPRRTRPSLASNMRRLLCRSAVRRGVMQGAKKSPASLSVVHNLGIGNFEGRRPWMAGSEATNAPLAVPQPRSRLREQGAHV